MAYGLILAMLASGLTLTVMQCNNDNPASRPAPSARPAPGNTTAAPVQKLPVPDFNQDSAFYFVDRQVKFGPRVPNS